MPAAAHRQCVGIQAWPIIAPEEDEASVGINLDPALDGHRIGQFESVIVRDAYSGSAGIETESLAHFPAQIGNAERSCAIVCSRAVQSIAFGPPPTNQTRRRRSADWCTGHAFSGASCVVDALNLALA